jgi:segregation and condensation protein A
VARDLLFARLLQYRAYREAAQLLAALMTVESRVHPRSVGLEEQYAALLPDVVIPVDAQGLAALAAAAMSAPKVEPTVRLDHLHARRVSVREEAVIVVDRLQLRSPQPFRALIHDCMDDVLRVVGRFLALLELYREGRVTLAQTDALGELLVTLIPRSESAEAARVEGSNSAVPVDLSQSTDNPDTDLVTAEEEPT